MRLAEEVGRMSRLGQFKQSVLWFCKQNTSQRVSWAMCANVCSRYFLKRSVQLRCCSQWRTRHWKPECHSIWLSNSEKGPQQERNRKPMCCSGSSSHNRLRHFLKPLAFRCCVNWSTNDLLVRARNYKCEQSSLSATTDASTTTLKKKKNTNKLQTQRTKGSSG